jgi:CHAT domain-containing protein
LPRESPKVLVSGLSESVQDFPALPSVVKEVDDVHNQFKNSAVLLDKTFLLSQLESSLQDTSFTIVHIASHGQFSSDPSQTFLLTYDDKLTMSRLSQLLQANQFRKQPVELLTLSACQTAVGDERAALGLAGVALRVGTRSAMASLWFISDQATAELVAEFYRQLENPELSKAQALRNAQLALAANPQFRHPAFWSPFLLIGNWL